MLGVAACCALACLSALPARAATAPRQASTLNLYAGQPQGPWQVVVVGPEGQARLGGDSNSVAAPQPEKSRRPDSHVSAQRSAKAGAADALTLQWRNAWTAVLRLEGGTPLDLRPYADGGTLEFDFKVVDLAQGGVTFKLGCGPHCERKLPYLHGARAIAGQGWQHLALPLRCFVRDGDDLSAVAQPFALEGTGSGEAALANVRIVRNGKPNATCPDYRTQAVTPQVLEESWSLAWWLPRHRAKLDEIRQHHEAGRRIELLFVGDSITQGWESEGRAVWEQHYARHNAVGLGFGGDRTENLLWRLQNGELEGTAPKVTVVMIGTNNTGHRLEDPALTAGGIQRNVEEIHRRLPDTKVLLLAIFPREQKPDGLLRRHNARINTLIAALADGRKTFFLDIGAAFTNPDGTLPADVMPDALHLSPKGYEIWARAIEPTLHSLLPTTPK